MIFNRGKELEKINAEKAAKAAEGTNHVIDNIRRKSKGKSEQEAKQEERRR